MMRRLTGAQANLKRYCEVFHPDIKKVATMPYWFASAIARLKGTKEIKSVSDFMAAFEKIGELGDPSEANDILGAPQITLDKWLRQKSAFNPLASRAAETL